MSSIPLADRDQHMLLLAGAHHKHQGARSNAATSLFHVTPTAFCQRINQLLDLEAALAWEPMLVNRLRTQRRSRVRERDAWPRQSELGRHRVP